MCPGAHGIKQQGHQWSRTVGYERRIGNGETHGAHGIKPFVVGNRQVHEDERSGMGAQMCHPFTERAGDGEVKSCLKMAHEQIVKFEYKTLVRLDEQNSD